MLVLNFIGTFNQAYRKKNANYESQERIGPLLNQIRTNYIKSTLDGLNGLLWEDDNQIVKIVAEKYYSDHPRVEIEVKGVKEDGNT